MSVDEAARLKAELADMQRTFDLRWKADMRAIQRWRAEAPDRDLIMPDHADLVVWLLDRHDQRVTELLQANHREIDRRRDSEAQVAALKADWDAAREWYERHRDALRAAGIDLVPDFMVPF